MRALVGGKGADWILENRDLPEQLGAVRVQVMAAGLNRADLYALDGSYTANSQGEGPFVAGMEVAGIVESSSLLAPHLPVGTRVMGITIGAFADYALCHPRMLVSIPDHLGFEAAASLPVGLITEHDALVTQAGFTAGDTVLIVGGTSAIGLIGIQLAKALGADTIAFRRQRLLGTTFSIRTRTELGDVVAALTDRVLPAVAAGKIVPMLDSVHPVDDAVTAARRLRDNGATGKVVLSFADAHTGPAPTPGPVANLFGGIAQIGYVVRDIEASMRNFAACGIGPWFFLRDVRPADFTYWGEPSAMAMDVAVANSGDIQIELISPTNDAPSMYRDFLDAGHEGVQHIAYWSDDYQGLYDRALAAGFTVGQEGRIGGADGRFAYLRTEHHPGTVIEISDVGGTKKFVFDLVKLAAANWDGSNPIQTIDSGLIGGDPAAMTAMLEALG